MKTRVLWKVIILLALAALAVSPVAAQSGGDAQRDEVFEREIWERLAAISPEAVPLFQQATMAMDSGDFMVALQLFQQVLEMAPDFPDALRRVSYIAIELGDIEASLAYSERAYNIDPSPYNKIAMASGLVATDHPEALPLAANYAKEAVAEIPDSGHANLILLEASVKTQDVEGMRASTSNLMTIAPDNPVPYFFGGIVAAEDGDWVKADSYLAQAETLGVDPSVTMQVREQYAIDENLATMGPGMWTVWFGWAAAGLGVIFLVVVIALGEVERRKQKQEALPQPA